MREALEAISADYAKGARGGPEEGLPAGERPVPVPIPSGGGVANLLLRPSPNCSRFWGRQLLRVALEKPS